MPVIRVSEQVNIKIRQQGKFGDSHDAILRRLLGLPKKEKMVAGPIRKIRQGILKILVKADGHQLRAGQVSKLAGLKAKVGPKTENVKVTAGGKLAARKAKQFKAVRASLLKLGFLEVRREGARNMWKLTPKGVARAKTLQRQSLAKKLPAKNKMKNRKAKNAKSKGAIGKAG